MKRVIVGINDLLSIKPDVSLDWDEENNNGLKAYEVLAHLKKATRGFIHWNFSVLSW